MPFLFPLAALFCVVIKYLSLQNWCKVYEKNYMILVERYGDLMRVWFWVLGWHEKSTEKNKLYMPPFRKSKYTVSILSVPSIFIEVICN